MDTNITLNELPIGKCAHISSLSLEGDMRRRLLDLGFAVGNHVMPLLVSPLGDPVAYNIMGSVVALRRNIASKINISPHNPQAVAHT